MWHLYGESIAAFGLSWLVVKRCTWDRIFLIKPLGGVGKISR